MEFGPAASRPLNRTSISPVGHTGLTLVHSCRALENSPTAIRLVPQRQLELRLSRNLLTQLQPQLPTAAGAAQHPSKPLGVLGGKPALTGRLIFLLTQRWALLDLGRPDPAGLVLPAEYVQQAVVDTLSFRVYWTPPWRRARTFNGSTRLCSDAGEASSCLQTEESLHARVRSEPGAETEEPTAAPVQSACRCRANGSSPHALRSPLLPSGGETRGPSTCSAVPRRPTLALAGRRSNRTHDRSWSPLPLRLQLRAQTQTQTQAEAPHHGLWLTRPLSGW